MNGAPEPASVARAPRSERIALLLAGVAGVLAVGASLLAAPGLAGAMGAALAAIMLVIAIADWRMLIIPDELTALAFAVGLAGIAAGNWSAMPAPALDALLRCAATASVFYAFRVGYRRLRGRDGMGLGDVKLAGAAGAWLDWASLPIAVEIAALSALALIGARRIVTGAPLDPLAKLPFGAFLAPAIWLSWWLARWPN